MTADFIDVSATSDDDIYVDSTAASGGAVTVMGTATIVITHQSTLAGVGDNATVNGRVVTFTSNMSQDIDGSADSYSLALASGAGGVHAQVNYSKSRIQIGNSDITSLRIQGFANNALTKDAHTTDGYNLRSGSASLGNVTILTSVNRFFNETDIDIQGNLLSAGTFDTPGAIVFEGETKLDVADRVNIESVSGFGVSVAVADLYADVENNLNIGSNASVVSHAGDVTFATKHEAVMIADTNLTVATALTGGAGGYANTEIDADNVMSVSGAVTGRTVNLYAGRDTNATVNDIYQNAVSNIAAFSTLPSINVPVARSDIDETNTININSGADLRAIEDVVLEARSGIGFDEGTRRSGEGQVISLSLIPYGINARAIGDDDSVNRVNIDSGARAEGGAFNQLNYHVFAVDADGTLAASNNFALPAEGISGGVIGGDVSQTVIDDLNAHPTLGTGRID